MPFIFPSGIFTGEEGKYLSLNFTQARDTYLYAFITLMHSWLIIESEVFCWLNPNANKGIIIIKQFHLLPEEISQLNQAKSCKSYYIRINGFFNVSEDLFPSHYDGQLGCQFYQTASGITLVKSKQRKKKWMMKDGLLQWKKSKPEDQNLKLLVGMDIKGIYREIWLNSSKHDHRPLPG